MSPQLPKLLCLILIPRLSWLKLKSAEVLGAICVVSNGCRRHRTCRFLLCLFLYFFVFLRAICFEVLFSTEVLEIYLHFIVPLKMFWSMIISMFLDLFNRVDTSNHMQEARNIPLQHL